MLTQNIILNSSLLLVSFCFLYWGVFETLFLQWRNNVMYSHGFLIPLISLYLVWVRKNELGRTPYLPKHEIAFAALGIGVAMVLIGHLAGVQIIQALSLIFTTTGIVVLIFGSSSLKIFWLPIVYLLFMIPVWEETITGRLHLPFQNFSAVTGSALLKLVGIPAYREGLYIALPETVLEVARACSGVNHLIAVVVIGIPLAYLFLKNWYKRTLLILTAILIAILANGLRVALIGILIYLNLGSPLHGPFHVLQGLFVSFVGYAALIITSWALSERSSVDRHQANNNEISASKGIVVGVARNPINRKTHSIFLAVLIFLASGSYIHFYKFPPTPLINSLDLFPQNISDWTGSPSNSMFSGWFKEAKVDQELSREYRENSQADTISAVELYIAYFESQNSKKKVINYRTEAIHQNPSVEKVDIGAGQALTLNRIIHGNSGKDKTVLFWYDIDGRIFTSRIKAKLYHAWNGLTRGKTNGAIVIVSSGVFSDGSPNDTEKQIKEFIKVVYPWLPDFLPGHK